MVLVGIGILGLIISLSSAVMAGNIDRDCYYWALPIMIGSGFFGVVVNEYYAQYKKGGK